jgi:hypothetical protein
MKTSRYCVDAFPAEAGPAFNCTADPAERTRFNSGTGFSREEAGMNILTCAA